MAHQGASRHALLDDFMCFLAYAGSALHEQEGTG